jgi:hypothetical protein
MTQLNFRIIYLKLKKTFYLNMNENDVYFKNIN